MNPHFQRREGAHKWPSAGLQGPGGHLATLVSKYPGVFWHRQGEGGLRCQAPTPRGHAPSSVRLQPPQTLVEEEAWHPGAVPKQHAHLWHTPDFPGEQLPLDCSRAWVSRTELLSILESLVGLSCQTACSHWFCLSRCYFVHPEEEPGCWSLNVYTLKYTFIRNSFPSHWPFYCS